MGYQTRDADGQPVTSRRKRDANAVGRSPNRDEYVKLMKAGWSSVALERFALLRYQETIHAQSFSRYRQRHGWTVVTPKVLGDTEIDPDALLDILHERAQLIRLQKARVEVDVEHELRMRKLFNTTRNEVLALNTLLNDSKRDLQDLGLFPSSPSQHQVEIHGAVGSLAPDMNDGRNRFTPPAATLGELLGSMGRAEEIRMARMLHEILPAQGGGNGSGNGHPVVEGEFGD